MKSSMRWSFSLFLSLFFLASTASADDTISGFKAQKLPNATLKVLPNGTDAKAETSLVPVASLLGKPIALLYWKPKDAASETELRAFQALQGLPLYKDKLHFFAVAKGTNPSEEAEATQRARELKLTLRLILDNNQLNNYLEAFFQFPRYGLIDKEGVVRVWNCAQLNEAVGGGYTFLKALNESAQGKAIPTLRGAGKLKNTHALIGKKLPDVGLDGVDGKAKTVSSYFQKGRPMLVSFWSVTCEHCKRVIPAVAKYWDARKGNLDMLTITRAPSEELRKMIRDLYKEKGLEWPVAYAPENATLGHYNIVKVPTVILVDKDMVIRHVWIQPEDSWLPAALEAALIKYGIF
jgi:peroxiredoxin